MTGPAATAAPAPGPGYAELQAVSNFSFLHGASHPEELVQAAAALGLRALGLADHATLAGMVRAHGAAEEAGLRLVVGARLDLTDGPAVLVYPTDRAAYGRLSRLLTLGRRRAAKGQCRLAGSDLVEHGDGQVVIVLPPEARPTARVLDGFAADLAALRDLFGDRAYLAVHQTRRSDDARRLARLGALADRLGVAPVATNDVLYHAAERAVLHDVLTCIRAGRTLHTVGRRLVANAERHLKAPAAMARLFAARPDAVARTLEIVERCRFSLAELRYEYPAEPVPAGRTPQQELERLTWIGAARHYPDGVPPKVRATLEHELRLIARLDYARYFLTVHDIVAYARSQGILCQGRGSAANSAVCFVLGITAVDPARCDLLFERFVSAERREPPDIDVDFEHERREEVIQYIYRKYGRERAGLAATVISYRSRLALREVGKALGLSPDTVTALARSVSGWGREAFDGRHLAEAGLDPADRTVTLALGLARTLVGFPRHLSQHPGGFVITRGRLDELVPIENAAMEDRTVIEWDKDDLDRLGLLKIDVLGLGMLSCVRRAFALLEARSGRPFGLTDVPAEDPAVYAMLQRADSLGVFQVESRAQMTMLPRLRPRTFYDLVIEVAIVRPGPIQGDMVHPYLRRRNGQEAVEFPSEELRAVLGKTLGVPLFQEQAMRIAIVAAGFTPGEADQLRRAMATFKRNGDIHRFRDRLIGGMVARGYDPGFAARCFHQIEGFGTYGFPESHAASFALLVYVSAWLKCRHPAVFCAALLNSQPMGFYAPAQIVRDAREHGVEVRPVDINHSEWDCTLEGGALERGSLEGGTRQDGAPGAAGPAVRLGLRQVRGLREADALRLAAARDAGYGTVREVWRRAGLGVPALEALARADAWGSLGLGRREALWQVRALGAAPLPLFALAEDRAAPGDNRPPPDQGAEPAVVLPALPLGEAVLEDYRALGLSLKRHPLALLRPGLHADGLAAASVLATAPDRRRVAVAGLVLVRQRPGTASGVIFATLEDETGVANVVIWPSVFERWRRAVLGARLLAVWGRVQRDGPVVHVVADRFADLSGRLDGLAHAGGRFTPARTPADEGGESGIDARAAIPPGRNFR